LPMRGTAPATYSSASASVVLPAPPWPTSATLRILSDDTVMLPSECPGPRELRRHVGPPGPLRRVYGRASEGFPWRPVTLVAVVPGRERTAPGMLDRRWRAKAERALDP